MKHIEAGSATDDCEALFVWTPEPAGTTIHFSNHSVGAGVNQFIWNFGDDSIASVYQQSYSYSEPGYYNVCLTAISTTTGCSNITCATVFTSDISDNVDADFEYTVDSLTNNVIFFDNSTGNISEWEWEFGDGDTSTAENPQHQYVQMGVYQVHLKITGASGSVSHAFRLISSTPYFGDLTASFGYVLDTLSKSEQYPADFKGAAFGDPAVISWSFGDGGVDSTTMFPYHIYEESGIYNACFTVSDPQCGTEDTYCQDIVIGNASIGEYADHGFISRIFPNPASEKLFVMMGTNVAGKFDLSVSDLSGRKVSEDVSVSCHAGTQIVSLDISGLKPGVYFVRIESEIAGITHKLVISR
ncbi:MAG: PKD domain-containing protein, partial [Bacteroidetes bacterium]|nr:PKD domain-containing protein [Bacteroidota bacterium]